MVRYKTKKKKEKGRRKERKRRRKEKEGNKKEGKRRGEQGRGEQEKGGEKETTTCQVWVLLQRKMSTITQKAIKMFLVPTMYPCEARFSSTKTAYYNKLDVEQI